MSEEAAGVRSGPEANSTSIDPTAVALALASASGEKADAFLDPLEGWGKALMARNQSYLALAKFAEAEKYPPNWGRLHLKWGEALAYAGKKNEVKAQFNRAAQLDLTPSEKSDLARVGPREAVRGITPTTFSKRLVRCKSKLEDE